MAEKSSEEIAHHEARKQWIKRWLSIITPAGVILSLILIFFVDSRAIVLSFSTIIILTLVVIFTIGSGNRPKKTRVYKDYSVKTIRPGAAANNPRNMPGNRPQGESSSGSSQFHHPGTTAEEYNRMKDAYNNPSIVVVQSKGGDGESKSQKGEQSKLGAQISNTAMVAFLVAAVILLWLFGGRG